MNAEEEEADAAFLKELADTHSYTSGRPASVQFLPGGTQLLFLRAAPNAAVLSLYSFDLKTKREQLLLTPESLLRGALEQLSPEEKARRERLRISSRGFTSYELSARGDFVLLSLSSSVYRYSLADGAVEELLSGQEGGAIFDPKLSPDDRQLAFVRGGELWVQELTSKATRQLTFGATELKTHAQAEFVAQEEMDRTEGYWWSPDSSMLLYEEANAEGVERLYLGDPATPAEVVPLLSYPRPGKKNVEVSLGLLSLNGGPTTWLTWDKEAYPYLARVLWPARAPLSLIVSSRDQRRFALLTVDEAGHTQTLLIEEDNTWLNLSTEYHWLPDGSGFLWPTEREGSWQLARYTRAGRFDGYLTPLSPGFRHLRQLTKDRVVVTGGADPLTQHLYAISLATGALTQLTEGEGFYDANFSESGAYVLTRASREKHPSQEVYSAEGARIGPLTSVAKEPPVWPQLTLTKVGEGEGFYAALIRPRALEAGKQYPVIVRTYGGPGARVVTGSADSYLLDQWIADHGFFVVKIDGRGTPDRGRAWERALYQKFSSVPLEDQIAGLRALAEREPALDLRRVGIIGHSFGGYMAALAILRRPDVYKAAVSSAPVVEWLDYDTFYTERYLGVPGEGDTVYAENSLLQYAASLSRPLLLIHGTADDNVHFSQTLKLSDALFRAGKSYELVALAGQTHMIKDVTDRYWQRVFSFFRKNL